MIYGFGLCLNNFDVQVSHEKLSNIGKLVSPFHKTFEFDAKFGWHQFKLVVECFLSFKSISTIFFFSKTETTTNKPKILFDFMCRKYGIIAFVALLTVLIDSCPQIPWVF